MDDFEIQLDLQKFLTNWEENKIYENSYKRNKKAWGKKLRKNTILSILAYLLIWPITAFAVLLTNQGSEQITTEEPIIPIVIQEVNEPRVELIQEIEEPEIVATEYSSLETMENYGWFTVTYYCGCEKCCGKWSSGNEAIATGALGTKLTAGYSLAVDKNLIPLGTKLYDIDGNEYKAEDTGSGIKGYHIDLFTGNHQEALNKGVTKEVFFRW